MFYTLINPEFKFVVNDIIIKFYFLRGTYRGITFHLSIMGPFCTLTVCLLYFEDSILRIEITELYTGNGLHI